MFPPLLYPDLTPKITEPTWFNVDTPVNQLEELDRLEEEFKDWCDHTNQMDNDVIPIGRLNVELRPQAEDGQEGDADNEDDNESRDDEEDEDDDDDDELDEMMTMENSSEPEDAVNNTSTPLQLPAPPQNDIAPL